MTPVVKNVYQVQCIRNKTMNLDIAAHVYWPCAYKCLYYSHDCLKVHDILFTSSETCMVADIELGEGVFGCAFCITVVNPTRPAL